MLARQRPVPHQGFLVQVGSFEHKTERALGHRAGDGSAANLDGHLVIAVGGVEVRRLVIAVVDEDDDAEEARNGRHDDEAEKVRANKWLLTRRTASRSAGTKRRIRRTARDALTDPCGRLCSGRLCVPAVWTGLIGDSLDRLDG